ncbi:unnamed protein product, partial [Owenia fusiformis]
DTDMTELIQNDIYSSDIDSKENGLESKEDQHESSTDDYSLEGEPKNAVHALPDGDTSDLEIQEMNKKIAITDQNVYYETAEDVTSIDDQSKHTRDQPSLPQNKVFAAGDVGENPYYTTPEDVNQIDDNTRDQTSSHQNETFAIIDDICEDPYYTTPATDVPPRGITLDGKNEEDGYDRIQLSVTKEVPKDRILDENYSHIRQHGDNDVYYSTPYNASEGNRDEVGSLNKSNAYSYVTKPSSRSSPPNGTVLDDTSSKRGVYTEGNKDNESNGKEIELIDNAVYSMEVKPETDYEAVLDEEEENNDSNGNEIELINNDIYSMEV